MRDLEKALSEISAIRSQIARSTEFQGFGPATLAATGVLAMIAAVAQSLWLTDPVADPAIYLALWAATAAVSFGVIVLEMVTRTRRIHSDLAQEMIVSAAENFLPAAGAGVALTAVLWVAAPQTLWMLPGLWQVVYALGVFASCRFLPKAMRVAGVWYLATGLWCLAAAAGGDALSPWAMGLPYGVGQLLIGVILQASLQGRRP
jgi:hypothetical protein